MDIQEVHVSSLRKRLWRTISVDQGLLHLQVQSSYFAVLDVQSYGSIPVPVGEVLVDK